MRKRKHPRPNQRRPIKVRADRRRVFLNFALGMAILMAIALIASNANVKWNPMSPQQASHAPLPAPQAPPVAN